MKFLIWFVCFFVCALVQVIIKNAGFILGGIPTALLVGLAYWAARSLCKLWDRHRAAKKEQIAAAAANAEPVDGVAVEHIAMTAPKKQRYCKFCGGAIDIETKKCEKCGKQYFRFRITKKGVLATCQCLMVLALISVIILQYVQYNSNIAKHKAEITALTEKAEDLDLELFRKNSEIKRMEQIFYNERSRLEFYDKYVVFVPLGESKYMDEDEYHKQDCLDFAAHRLLGGPGDFSALDVDLAEYMGYKPCPDCCN